MKLLKNCYHTLAVCALLVVGLTPAGTGQQIGGRSEQPPSRDLRCVLKVENPAWKRGEPALVSLQLENLTDRDLEFETIPELYLSSYRSDYWAPTDIVGNKPIETRKVRSNGIEPVPIKLKLTRRSLTSFPIDAAITHWQETISPIWPSVSLRAIQPGNYSLRLELGVYGNLIRSNEVRIVIGEEVPR